MAKLKGSMEVTCHVSPKVEQALVELEQHNGHIMEVYDLNDGRLDSTIGELLNFAAQLTPWLSKHVDA